MPSSATALEPVRWLRRAVRIRGTERHALTQAVKAGVAAGLAWLVAARLLAMPQPFLAPYAAVYAVEATVYRSFLSSARQVAAVAIGVLLAWVANLLAPTVIALPLAVVAGLLVGRWRRFGQDGVWIASTAVLVLSVSPVSRVLVLDRLGETVLGVLIGAVLNAALFPPVYRDRAAAVTARLGEEVAALLHEMAAGLRDTAVTDRTAEWVQVTENLRDLVREVDETSGLTAESRVLNLRRARPRYRAGPTRDGAQRLIVAWPHLHAFAQSLHHVAAGAGTAAEPDPDTSAELAELLDGMAEAVETDTGDRRTVIMRRNHERLAELERRAAALAPDALPVTMGLGGLTPPLHRILHALDDR
jgi:hypothetical protein